LLVNTLKLGAQVAKETLSEVVGDRIKLLRLFPKLLVKLKLVMGLKIVLFLPPYLFIKA